MIEATPVFQEPPAAPAAPPREASILYPWDSCFSPWYEGEATQLGLWLRDLSDARQLLGYRRLLARVLRDGRLGAPGWNELFHECGVALRRWPVLQAAFGVDDAEAARLCAWPAPPEIAEREQARAQESSKDKRDDWRHYRTFSALERGLLADYSIPFEVHGCRRRSVVSWKPVRQERETWQLLVREGPLRLWGIVSVPVGNEKRDAQLAWLLSHVPLDTPLCLYHQQTGAGHRLLCLKRTTWPADPAVWDALPLKARNLLRRNLDAKA